MTAREVIDEMREFAGVKEREGRHALGRIVGKWANRLEALAPPADLAPVAAAIEWYDSACRSGVIEAMDAAHIRAFQLCLAYCRALIAPPALSAVELEALEKSEELCRVWHLPDFNPFHIICSALRSRTTQPAVVTDVLNRLPADVDFADKSYTNGFNDALLLCRQEITATLTAALAPGGGSAGGGK